jgi:CheY-like chemotaxis protein
MEENKTILVVEDEKPLMDAIKKKLEISGFNVVSARDVPQAIGYLDDLEKIDLVWLDHYLLGKENGLDLVTKMKAEDSRWKNIHIFVVSNTATPEKINSYLYLGVDKYYTKSDYRLDDIIMDINKLLAK